MHRPTLPIESLPMWARLNNVSFHIVKLAHTTGKGYGVVCAQDREPTDDASAAAPLLTVPHALVLNAASVDEYAKEDINFRQLLDAVGHRSPRADTLLFLLVQTALASRSSPSPVGVSNPWTEYLQFLPATVLVPTLWTEDERLLLRGTSLEAAVDAKISALDAEFGLIVEKSSDVPCWRELFWDDASSGGTAAAVEFTDWIRLDALYRSRCLELPRAGESMVPCIDMVNHSGTPSAYYDESARDDDVVLLPGPGVSLKQGDEVTISYGEDKSAAEMLFSYGFIDPQHAAPTASGSLVLPLSPFPDDPLAKAKLVAFGEAPKIHVARDAGTTLTVTDRGEDGEENGGGSGSGSIRWRSPFAYLMCVNEEDGLEFKVLQQTDGARSRLRVFWLGEDVTDRTSAAGGGFDFEALVGAHPMAALLRLRVVTVVLERLQAQLERLGEGTEPDPADVPSGGLQRREECVAAAALLRQAETGLLVQAVEKLEEERSLLLTDQNVAAYLGLKEAAESDLECEEASNEAEDFS
ncbi:hypothetical protein C8A05DRAFT_44899 [Staphylotrichum tortipilum]|uniref:SET domain-containing protein n=1 Tax=Staphylotrichum tortipilum TaxID=2831512 RepID=A0AAN6RSS2_9PEZI|nr:hypothetical protein C8A05DRAFT_44899 [Staphylotrichum longicolle]